MPITAVLDASFAIALFVPHVRSAAAQSVLNYLSSADATMIAPTLWFYEVNSGIHKLAHFKEISDVQAKRAYALVEEFQISLVVPDHSLARRAVAWSQRLHRASTYDSFYLALAEERGCDLWTADSRLSNAVRERWVRVLA